MELSDYVRAVEESNSRIPLDEILAGNSFEKVVVTSTGVKEIFSSMESYFKKLKIKYALGPSIECHLKFGRRNYDPAKNIFITIFREREYPDLKAIDEKAKMNIGVLVYSQNNGQFKELPWLENTIIIQPSEAFAAEERAVKAVFWAGYFLAKGRKDDALMERMKKFRDDYMDGVLAPGK